MLTILYILAIAFYALMFGVLAFEAYKRYIKKRECEVTIILDTKTGLEYFLTSEGGICPRMASHDTVKGTVKASNPANDAVTIVPFVGKVQ